MSWRHFLLVFLFIVGGWSLSAKAQVLRIASLSYCHDQMLEQWLQPEQTLLTSQEFGRRLERVIQFQPDVVLVNPFNNPQYARVLRAQGLRVVEVSEPTRLAAVPAHWREVIHATQLGMQAELALADLQRTLQQPARDPQGTFIAYQANQWSWGQNNLIHDLMTLYGYRNLAQSEGVLQRMQVEEVVWLQPDILLMEPPSEHFALAHLNQWHRALPAQIIEMPRALGACIAQRLPEAISALETAIQLHEASR